MAQLFCDGFDFYNYYADPLLNYWSDTSGSYGFSSVTPYNTGQSLQLINGNYMDKQGLPNTSEFYLSVYMRTVFGFSGSSTGTFFSFMDGTAPQLTAMISEVGKFYVLAGGPQATPIGNSVQLWQTQTWFHLQIYGLIDSDNGVVTLRVNGNPHDDFTLTGINTRNGTANNWFNVFRVGVYAPNSSSYYVDDLFLCSADGPAPNSWTGEIRCFQQMPVADIQAQFQPNTGSTNFSAVNAPINNEGASYVASSIVGANDLYALAALPETPQTIIGVNSRMFARKSDAGYRAGQFQLRSGSTLVTSPSVNLAQGFENITRFDAVDPATGEAWTAAGVDALEIGPVVTG